MSSHLRRALALALFCPAALAAPPDDPLAGQQQLTAQALVRLALARNPSVAAALSEAAAAEARPAMAGALPDPMLEWSFAPLSIGTPGVDFGTTVGVTQRLPFPGKWALRSKAAAHDARAARLGTAEVRLALAEAAVGLHADWFHSARALAVNRAHEALLRELQRAAEAQYTAGTAPQADVLRAELMLAELAQQRLELESQARRLALRINALLHRPLDAAVPPPPAALEPGAAPTPASELAARAQAAHPALAALEALEAGAAARVELGKWSWAPDLQLMASYSTMWAMPQHRLMVGLGVELPVWQPQRQAEVREAQAMAEALGQARAHQSVEVAALVREAFELVAEATALRDGLEARVLPAARASLESARASYVTGKAPFQTLIEAERALRDAELALHTTTAELARRRAALDRAAGVFPFAAEESR
jgi:outer membrane protein, heavy metal efflux system